MWTAISLAGGLAGTLTGLIAVIWLAKKLIAAHGQELDEVKANAGLTKRVDDLTRAVEDHQHALDAITEQLHGEQQARVLAEKHRDELLKALANVAPAHILLDGIRRELGLLQNLSAVPAPASDSPTDKVHGIPAADPRP